MTDLKISQFVDGGAVSPTDEIATNRAGINTKVFVGTAASLDAGTGNDDIPQNSDLGSAAYLNAGAGIANVLEVVDVGGNPALPAIDGSQLINLPAPATGVTAAAVLADNMIVQGAGGSRGTDSNATGNRIIKVWATDIESNNAAVITGETNTGSGGYVRKTSPSITGATITGTVNGATPITANQKFIVNVGTAYTLTATSAPVTNGTTSPKVTLDSPGTYAVWGYMRVEYNGATFAASRTITAQINRTNNTPGLISGAAREFFNTAIETTQTKTGPIFNFFYAPYVTANNDDELQLYADVSTLPSAGTVTVPAGGGKLMAIRLTQ